MQIGGASGADVITGPSEVESIDSGNGVDNINAGSRDDLIMIDATM